MTLKLLDLSKNKRWFGFLIYFCVTLQTALFFHLPPWILDLNGSDFTVSATIAMFGLGGICARPFAGSVIDKNAGFKAIIISSLILFFCSLFFLFISQINITLYLIRFLQGFGFGMITSFLVHWTASTVSLSKQVQEVGYLTAFGSAAVGVSAPLGNFLIDKDDFSRLFLATSFLCLLGILLLTVIINTPASDKHVKKNTHSLQESFFRILSEKRSLPLWIFAMSFSIPMAGVFAFAKVYEEILNLAVMTPLFVSCILSTVLTRVFFKFIPDKLGFKWTLTCSVTLLFISLSVLATNTNYWWICFSGALLGFSQAFVVPLLVSFIKDQFSESRQGSGISILMGIFDGGSFFAGIFFALLLSKIQFESIIFILACFPVFGFFIFYMFFKSNQKHSYARKSLEKQNL